MEEGAVWEVEVEVLTSHGPGKGPKPASRAKHGLLGISSP